MTSLYVSQESILQIIQFQYRHLLAAHIGLQRGMSHDKGVKLGKADGNCHCDISDILQSAIMSFMTPHCGVKQQIVSMILDIAETIDVHDLGTYKCDVQFVHKCFYCWCFLCEEQWMEFHKILHECHYKVLSWPTFNY